MKTLHMQSGKRMIGIAGASALLLLASCSAPKDNDAAPAGGTPVKIVHPSTSSLAESMECNATTAFLKKEIVRSTFQGFIQKTNKAIGDNIQEGEILLYLKTKEAPAADSPGIHVNDNLFRGTVPLTAKSTGVLTEMNFHAGEYVQEGEQLAVIANPSSLVVMLNVPYQNASQIGINTRCTVILPNGRRMDGTVASALPSVDPASQTQSFIIRCADMAHVPANLNLVVTIPVRAIRNAVVLPKRAIQSNETLDSFWIMKLVNDSIAVKVPIVKGSENDSLVQILAPVLNAAERIVFEGGYGLPDTARVSIGN
jgi:Barrel-sandwich domain of CusB or HlyD membrane-fusion